MTAKRFTLLILLLMSTTPWVRAETAAQQAKVEAAFIYNFARFIEWPDNSFENSDAPFVIAVVGPDPFDQGLDQIVAGKKIANHRVEIHHYEFGDKVGPCQVVFIAAADDRQQADVIQQTANRHVLTVGDTDNFSQSGGTFRLFTEDSKMRFEVNMDAADRAQLKISSKLLKLARIFKK